MTPADLPLPEPDGAGSHDALERLLHEQALLPAPPDLAARVVAGLPRPARRVLSHQAIARLAAAVLLAIGTWVATIGGMPTLAHAEPPPLVEEVLVPTRALLPSGNVDLKTLGLEDAAARSEDVPAAALAAVGAALLGAGLLLARRGAKEKTS